MTNAERMRKITDEVVKSERAKYVAKNVKYANKIVNRKVRNKAESGRGSCAVKVSRRYSPSLVVDAISDMGFNVIRNSKNGRAILTIKW
jgi:hypothetical protein